MPELAGKTRRSERQRVTFRVMKFGRYVTVDDGGNNVTFHELNQRLRKDKKITKAQSDSVSSNRTAVSCFFLVLSVTRPSPSLGQVLVGTLNHATCNVYSPKAFETLIYENVTHADKKREGRCLGDYYFLYCV